VLLVEKNGKEVPKLHDFDRLKKIKEVKPEECSNIIDEEYNKLVNAIEEIFEANKKKVPFNAKTSSKAPNTLLESLKEDALKNHKEIKNSKCPSKKGLSLLAI